MEKTKTKILEIASHMDDEALEFWNIDKTKPIIQTGKVYFRNGEHHVPTSQGHFPYIFFK